MNGGGRAVPGKFLHKIKIPEFDNELAFVGIEKEVISAWLIGCLKAMQGP